MSTYAPRLSAMPATPRGGTAGASSSTTPRSARRVLASSTSAGAPLGMSAYGTPSRGSSSLGGGAPLVHPPLPPINTRAYPDRAYADDEDLRLLLDADREAVDTAVSLLEHSLSGHKKAVFEAREEIAAERTRLEKMTRELGDAAKELVKTVQRERDEMDRAREMDAEVQTRSRSLMVQVETAQAEVKEILSKLEARRELKAKQRAAFAKQVSRNAPELDFFEQKLGLKIRGKARDVVQFKFHNIDSASFPRTFSFDLDASKPTYTVPATSPAGFLPPQTLTPLLARLNKTRDLYAFIRAVRGAFVEEVAFEKRGGEAEGERERERGRGREEREREGARGW
ncbi:hypothetical protein JCM6882_003015 [Rhodosporidiobolus microsporus]